MSLKLHFSYRARRIAAVVALLGTVIGIIIYNPSSYEYIIDQPALAEQTTPGPENLDTDQNRNQPPTSSDQLLATTVLEQLEIKGRAPKTGYTRTEFYSSWPKIEGCSLRQRIIRREVGDTARLTDDACTVISGEFDEPYTGKHLVFNQKSDFSSGLQIDHIVALSDAWQKGAQYLSPETRYQIATDPLNLLAVDSSANQGKSDGDAATWLPPNKAFRCQYVARQISVKYKYQLWVTSAEHDAIARVLEACPNEPAVGVSLRE